MERQLSMALEYDSTLLQVPREGSSTHVAMQGAKQGEQRAMNRLRQSRSTRNKSGDVMTQPRSVEGWLIWLDQQRPTDAQWSDA